MSLFDILRYPVTDIYREDDLTMLPEDLYRAWITSFYDIRVNSLSPLRHIEVRSTVLLKVRESKRNSVHYRSQEGWEDLWKAVFTKFLIKLIQEYDTT